MKARPVLLTLISLAFLFSIHYFLYADNTAPNPDDKLAVVWTSGDPEVAHKVCFMYTEAARSAGWFDDVTLIVWGPSSRLLATDRQLQAKVKQMIDSGIKVQACVVCADMYKVSGKLRELGITVKPMGEPLSDMLKSDCKVLTF